MKFPLLNDQNHAWSGPDAKKRWRQECSSDGSGSKDTMDWGKFAKGFFYVDGDEKSFGSYHLGYVDVVDGKAAAIWHGVTACAAAVGGARGAGPYPDSVKSEIAAYYSKARQLFNDDSIKVPWETKTASEGEERDADAYAGDSDAYAACAKCGGTGYNERGGEPEEMDEAECGADEDDAVCPDCLGSGLTHAVEEEDGHGKARSAEHEEDIQMPPNDEPPVEDDPEEPLEDDEPPADEPNAETEDRDYSGADVQMDSAYDLMHSAAAASAEARAAHERLHDAVTRAQQLLEPASGHEDPDDPQDGGGDDVHEYSLNDALDQIAELRGRLNEEIEMRKFEARYGKIGGKEVRELKLSDVEVRDSGAGQGAFTIQGHAAVFNSRSLDLGFFEEEIDPHAFDNVLARDPDVHLNWDHDMRYVLARTKNGTLELGLDEIGLTTWARVAPTSYANDLRILMERGDIDQMSFCFTVKRDRWEVETRDDGTEIAKRTILEVGELYDTCVTAQGAYPATDSEVIKSALLSRARHSHSIDADEAVAHTHGNPSPSAQSETDPEPARASKVKLAQAKARAKRARSRG